MGVECTNTEILSHAQKDTIDYGALSLEEGRLSSGMFTVCLLSSQTPRTTYIQKIKRKRKKRKKIISFNLLTLLTDLENNIYPKNKKKKKKKKEKKLFLLICLLSSQTSRTKYIQKIKRK